MIQAVFTSTKTARSSGVWARSRTPTTRMRSGYAPARSKTLSGDETTKSPGPAPSARAASAPSTHSPSTAIGRPAASRSERTAKYSREVPTMGCPRERKRM